MSENKKIREGVKIAALRVKQLQKRESRRWSPSGKTRRRLTLSTPVVKTVHNAVPWNDRFIFNDENQHEGRHIRILSARKRFDEKENEGNPNPLARRFCHVTERSDGEAVATFQHVEVKSSALVESRNIALSPFDMKKVKAALDANRPKVQFDAKEAQSILDQFEELVFTLEIEEELMRQELLAAKLQTEVITLPNKKCARESSSTLTSTCRDNVETPGNQMENRELSSESSLLVMCITSLSEEIENAVKRSAEGILNQLSQNQH